MAGGIILVTGSAGRIGQAVVRELIAREQPIRGFDIMPTPGVAESCIGDISSLDSVREAIKGVSRVIHLAAIPDDDDFMSRLLPTNIVGVYNLIESAREAKVDRVVLASTGQVVWWQRMRGEVPIGVDTVPTPRGWYAAGKCFLEAAGRALAESEGIPVIAARLGWCPRTLDHVRELRETPWAPDVYLSPGDAGRFFADAVLAPAHFTYALLYACSKPVTQETYDLEPARKLLGWEPRDRWPDGSEDW